MGWYVIYTAPQAEYSVQKDLDSQGFRTFLPQFTRWITHSRVRKIVSRPLFSRYVFVECDPAYPHQFGMVRDTDGVEELLAAYTGADPLPMALPVGLIEALIARQLAGEWNYAAKEPLTKGARIKIMDGHYADMLATVITLGGKNGAEVLAQLLGSRTRSRFALFSVRPA